MPKSDNREAWEGLVARLCCDFGEDSAAKILEVIVQECGGLRVTIPSMRDLHIEERDRRICARFRGDNHKELGIMFGLAETSIRRIVQRERSKPRGN